ncbi:MAG: riboflavin biosynthesis protein [Pseudopedobacter saltans]|uniref:Riboflavin biosynthesis protein n=1 Tax=Pseudopedobacter saltans TaxID=151895 RepID=A0A2W5F4C1_9SPHI|nr:MAG: riboflavin biosynthesis protein [Pseudopedobacter saltans]
MTIDEYKERFTEDDAVGWLSIDQSLEKVYKDQKPQHFAPILHYAIGGEDPLDGISVYESEEQVPHYHIVSYGFSNLYYDEDAAGNEYSKFGFEMTFRLKKNPKDDNFAWACNLMQNLAKYVFKTGKWFDEYHFIPANGPIRLEYETDITAIAFVLDPELGEMETPNGKVMFLQMVGLTTSEYENLKLNPKTTETKKLLDNLQKENPLLITDLDRKS